MGAPALLDYIHGLRLIAYHIILLLSHPCPESTVRSIMGGDIYQDVSEAKQQWLPLPSLIATVVMSPHLPLCSFLIILGLVIGTNGCNMIVYFMAR